MSRFKTVYASALLSLALALGGCQSSNSTTSLPEQDSTIALSGGSATVFDTSNNAYSHLSPLLTGENRSRFFVGKSFFDQNWVEAGASASGRDGLGPYFNARSCAGCHIRDGRGAPPEGSAPFVSLLLRLSIPGEDTHGGPLPDPNYGGQIQGFSLQNIETEADATVTYTELPGTFPDGEAYSLAMPEYTLSNLNYGPLDPQIMISPRIAQPMIGLGLLDEVTEEDILSYADENDADNDGISGRPNYVWDAIHEETRLGRFGWKANQPSIRQQVAGAFLGDIGITSSLFSNQNITTAQEEATEGILHGGDPELSDSLLDDVEVYSRGLAVPARREWNDTTVQIGESLFESLGCAKCHRSEMPVNGEIIHPYTDLLIHDMGEGLADNRPDFEATGQEWRTPPLWGIGLTETVNGHTRFLHDGRARNLNEAILWHGGEAEDTKNAYKNLSKSNRDAVIAFLESL